MAVLDTPAATANEPTPAKAVPGKPFLTFLRYNLPYRRAYMAGAVLALVFVSIELGLPLLIRLVVKLALNKQLTPVILLSIFFGIVAIAVIAGFARYWERLLIIGASRRFEYDLRNDYFGHVQRLSRGFFHRFQTGDIMARATNDLNYVRLFVGPGVMGTVDMIRAPFILAVMTYLSPSLTLTALLPLPFLSLLVYFFVMYTHRQSKRVQELFAAVSNRAQENLAGARVVKAYGAADRQVRDFRRESTRYMRESMKLSFVMSLVWPLIGLFIGLVLLLVLWRGGLGVINGEILFWNMSGFIVCLLMLTWPLAQFGWILTLYQRGAAGMNRILDVFAETPAVRDTPRTRHDIEALTGAFRFEDVSFAYPSAAPDGERTPALEQLSFSLESGATVAIAGPTGSGKSTIVSLLTREYDPQSGAILAEATSQGETEWVNLCEVPVALLRGAIGCVPQDTFLFSDTILANLVFGRPGATGEETRHAAEVAQLHETITGLPQAYDTLLGERGINLSGGQKQRLAIARAVVRDPTVLILDDALSSVDTHTEEEILSRLKTVMAERTSIVISHRVSTVRHADRIIVLDAGHIVEQGAHDDLVAAQGLYAAMYERQLLERALEDEA